MGPAPRVQGRLGGATRVLSGGGHCLPFGIGRHGGVDGHHGVVRSQQRDGRVPGRHTVSVSLSPKGQVARPQGRAEPVCNSKGSIRF